MSVKLNWKPNPNVSFPKTWAIFKAKDLASDGLVEYRIENLPEDRFQDLFDLFIEFLKIEPRYAVLNAVNDPPLVRALRIFCELAYEQQLINVCFCEGSDEMIGFNIMWAVCKDDNIDQQIAKLETSEVFKAYMKPSKELYAKFNVYDHYNVDKFMTTCGVYCKPKYCKLGIGKKLMEVSKPIGLAHGIEIFHAKFASSISNKIADQLGFELNSEYDLGEEKKLSYNPAFNPTITAKTWIF